MVVCLFRSFKITVWVSVRVTPDAIANVAVSAQGRVRRLALSWP